MLNRFVEKLSPRHVRTLMLVFVALFVATRVVLLLTSFENFTHEEEPQRARLGNDLLEGLVQPILYYQFLGINGGSIPFGILEAIFFFFFGNSYFAIKLCAVALGAAGSVLLLVFMNHTHGRGPTLLAGLLLLFPPTHVICNNLMEADQHNSFFVLAPLAWLLWRRYLITEYGDERPDKPTVWTTILSHWRPFVLGLLCGFAAYCYPSCAMIAVTLLASWFVVERWFFTKRPFAFFSIGFVVALIPQFVFFAIAAGIRREFLFSESARFTVGQILSNVRRFFVIDTANSTGLFIKGVAASVPALGYYFNGLMWALMIAYIVIYWKRFKLPNRDPNRTLWAFLPAMVLMSCAGYFLVIGDLTYTEMRTGFAKTLVDDPRRAIAYRYFTWIFYCFIAIGSIVMYRMMTGGKALWRYVAWANFAIVLLSGISSYAWLVKAGDIGDAAYGFSRPGYWYDIPRLNFYKWTNGNLEKCVRIIHSTDPKYHRLLYMGLGESLPTTSKLHAALIKAKKGEKREVGTRLHKAITASIGVVETLPEKYKPALYAGLGTYVSSILGYRESKERQDPKFLKSFSKMIPERYFEDFTYGYDREGGQWTWKTHNIWDDRTRRRLWALYHSLKGRRYEPCYWRY